MADYIDRAKLGIGECNRKIFENKSYADGWNAAIKILQEAPVADVAEVRHGEWVEYGGETFCSECRESAPYEISYAELFDYDWNENLVPCGYEEHKEYTKTNYCSNCGAKMDGESGG